MSDSSIEITPNSSLSDFTPEHRVIPPEWVTLLRKFFLSFRSPQTQKTYWQAIQKYLSFFPHTHWDRMFQDETLLIWMKKIDKQVALQETSRQTANTYNAALSSFFKFLAAEKQIPSDCHWIFKRHRYEQRTMVTQALTLEQVQMTLRFFEQLKRTTTPQTRSREYAILWECLWLILCTVGLRVSELCQIRIGDCYRKGEHPRLLLRQKGSRENEVLIHETLFEKIEHYKRLYRPVYPQEPLFVIPGRTERPIHRFYVHQNLKKIFQQLGLGDHLSTHSCRSFVASILQEQGVPLIEVQRLLGHRNINTTIGYIRTFKEYEESAARKSPLFKNTNS